MGFGVDEAEIETTPHAAARLLEGKRVLALTMAATHADLAPLVKLVDEGADVVLLGGVDESDETPSVFSYENLSRAFAELQRGARLVCLHKNRWWQTAAGPRLDGGAFAAGLEYAAGVEAEVLGKPSRAFFEAALAELGAQPEEAIMVGDDVESDIGGAKALGLRAILVRTGKFREESLAAAQPAPDDVVDSISDVPALLERAAPIPALSTGHCRRTHGQSPRVLKAAPQAAPKIARMKVGVDLIEIARIERALRRPGFAARVFTEAEREYCDSRAKPAQSYAGRFAGKEAVGKALGCGVRFTWREIEIVGRPKPGVRLSGWTKAWAERVGAGAIDLSMTHSKELAAAICVVTDAVE